MKDIKTALRNGVVKFSYKKNDGSIRTALGTTKADLLKKDGCQNKGGESKVKYAGYISYYDLEKHNWRCFAESRLCGEFSMCEGE